ncbi:MAG TPA: BCD family MFS transporter, partial [Roseococcus sp.]|nr:BCD family MFS transporter [Roseococcus sp.]
MSIAATWTRISPRFLPFADEEALPTSRLARLALFQITVGLTAVLLIGTLNRVMIVELGVSAALVSLMVSLPLVLAPFRALIGFRSDRHRSALGWKRVPYIWIGSLLQFCGLAIMPFALIILSGDTSGPAWVGPAAAALAFLMVGAGMHTVQTAGLALATDLCPPEAHPRVVVMLSLMLLVGMVAGSVGFGALLADFSQLRLIQVIQGAGVLVLALNCIALWKQEPRGAARRFPNPSGESFPDAWRVLRRHGGWTRRLLTLGLGSAGFAMQDVLLEPYGGQVLGLSVGATTLLTSLFAGGGLLGFAVAARALARGADAHRLAASGLLAGVVAVSAVLFSAPLESVVLFASGTILIGFGALLADFSQLRLIQVIQGAGVLVLALNCIALWKQEPRGAARRFPNPSGESFLDAWRVLRRHGGWTRRLLTLGLGSAGFAMQDVLLEPYGGQVLGLSVGATTL